MLLVLHSSSDVACSSLADLIVKKRKAWRHLPAEDPGGIGTMLGLDFRSNPDIGAMILAESIRTLAEEGHHVVQAGGEEDEMLAQLPELLEGESRRVFLGKEDDAEGDYDLIIPHKGKSVQDALKKLEPLLKEMEGS